ncbi:MAG TPA: YeeE/YedE thiosulfate transporter family protein [Sphingomonas sp.]|nr:YeeE/YedE thiosulfate transporter family protein [Sphingomonas sp.]
MVPLAVALALVGVIGWSVNEGGLCAVAAARELVTRRAGRLFAGSILASATTGALLLPVAWVLGPGVRLVGSAPIDIGLVAGAALLGLGAVVNDACLLGSLARLGDGELRFLAMPLGIATGFASVGAAAVVGPSQFAQPSLTGIALIGISLALGIVAIRRLRRAPARLEGRRWSLTTAMIVLGLAGGALYAIAPGWTWSDAIRRNLPYAMAMGDGGAGTALAIATVAGSVQAAILDRRFRPRRPLLADLVRSFAGGWIMAVGATMVPGGNDSLLLAAIPSGSISGVLAYAVMTVTIALLLAARRRRERNTKLGAERGDQFAPLV